PAAAPVAEAAVAVMAVAADSGISRVSPQLRQAGELLLEFEHTLKLSAQAGTWIGMRDRWRQTVADAGSVPALGAALAAFEASIVPAAKEELWRARQASWRQAVQSAATLPQLVGLIVEFENMVAWEATEEPWRARREAWLAELQRLTP
ncbi:MAG TPA: hypothetical protein PKM88_15745, partial [bacterium]|nr:hypothetical protein [bacterium]